MFRPTVRQIARAPALRRTTGASPAARRFLSTAPPTDKSRSWKNKFVRLGLAGAVVYYGATTDVFAEEPRQAVQPLPSEPEPEKLQTLEALEAERAKRKAAARLPSTSTGESAQPSSAPSPPPDDTIASPQDLEDEAGQQGAFNPETGEINWDCPCLGGMADGPCGEEFKAAFSCFVYSTEEPKGMDCVEKFKDMQNCFRKYPEIYGNELETDDDDDDDVPADAGLAPADVTSGAAPSGPLSTETEKVGAAAPKDLSSSTSSAERQAKQERSQAATDQVRHDHGQGNKEDVRVAATNTKEQAKKEHDVVSESDEVVPKAWHDQKQANEDARKQ